MPNMTNVPNHNREHSEPSTNGKAQTAPPEEVVYNPLKLDKLRTKSDVLKGVWTDPSRIPVLTRPEPNTWVRVRPGEEYTAVIDLLVATNASNSNDRNPLYVATDAVRPELERFIKPHRVAVGSHLSREGGVRVGAGVWAAATTPGHASIMRAMDRAETHWVALESDRALGEYKIQRGPALGASGANRSGTTGPLRTCWAWRSAIGSSTRWTTTSPSACSGSTDMLVLPYREVWADRHGVQSPTDGGPHLPGGSATGGIHPASGVPGGPRAVQRPQDRTVRGRLRPGAAVSTSVQDVLFIAYNAVAEWLTFLALGWPLPCRVFDPYIEYRRHICGTPRDINVKGNKSFLMALEHFGIARLTAEEKDEERDFVLRGGPWPDPADRRRILTYCDTDVRPLFQLTEHLLYADCCGKPLRSDPAGLAQAIHRGRYSLASARMEHTAIAGGHRAARPGPGCLGCHPRGPDRGEGRIRRVPGRALQQREVPGVHGRRLGIHWPRHDSGLPKTDRDTFEDMVRRHPQIAPIAELRYQLSELHLEKLQIGADGRNRAGLMMFGSKTGRNTPIANKYLFGLAQWVRHFLKPPPGYAVAYLDYRNQEYHIAGVLSGDAELLEVLAAPDPYMAFAITAGLAPAGATKQTHPVIRAICKMLLLGTNYGMGAESFAFKANIPIERAEHIHSSAEAHVLAVSPVVQRGGAGGPRRPLAAHRVRVAAVHGHVRRPHHPELEDAGQRCRDDAARLLFGDRARCAGLWTDSRRDPDRGPARRHRRCGDRRARRHGGGIAGGAGRSHGAGGRRGGAVAGSVSPGGRPGHVGTSAETGRSHRRGR